ncbi:proteasome subunit alpha [Bailinhaonella thermotolerans]|uniref:Proteasome subunit alpha n=2 Tax=Bailinhaonella thermotolerans TaxID=1070861 RepID=A0A3A4B3F1_9ACTN|nr:proteasome subunit alpha [Bailinhaonella thermotolerans]
MPFYVPTEQSMRDKADYARKGIARGRSVVVLQYADGILFVAPNPSRALHKISEIYDRIGFAAAGSYREFEALRGAGVRYADINGYTFDRRDVTGRGLANFYAQMLGAIFTESSKPYEVEIVVAEVGESASGDQIYRLTFDGSVVDEHGFVAMGGQADAVAGRLRERYRESMTMPEALAAAVAALTEPNGEEIPSTQLEVAMLDRKREHRKFRRLTGARLERALEESRAAAPSQQPAEPAEPGGTGTAEPAAPSGEAAPKPPAQPREEHPPTGPEGEGDTGSGGPVL